MNTECTQKLIGLAKAFLKIDLRFSPQAFLVLSEIAQAGEDGITNSEIMAKHNLKMSTVTRVTRQLTDMKNGREPGYGLCEYRYEGDLRLKYFVLTDDGKEFFEGVNPLFT